MMMMTARRIICSSIRVEQQSIRYSSNSIINRNLAKAFTQPAKRFFSLPAHQLVNMPALSPTMTSGTIASWGKAEGEKVNVGDVIAEVETDKATVAFEAQDEFFIAKHLVQAGAEVIVGQPILIQVDDEKYIPAFKTYVVSAVTAPPTPPPATTPSPSPAITTPAPPTPPPKVSTVTSTPAPKVSTPVKSDVDVSSVHPAAVVGSHWGTGISKSALFKKLQADQTVYINKYGRSTQKPVTSK